MFDSDHAVVEDVEVFALPESKVASGFFAGFNAHERQSNFIECFIVLTLNGLHDLFAFFVFGHFGNKLAVFAFDHFGTMGLDIVIAFGKENFAVGVETFHCIDGISEHLGAFFFECEIALTEISQLDDKGDIFIQQFC